MKRRKGTLKRKPCRPMSAFKQLGALMDGEALIRTQNGTYLKCFPASIGWEPGAGLEIEVNVRLKVLDGDTRCRKVKGVFLSVDRTETP